VLGGEMGKAIDWAGIQFRRLNTSKGPAVRSSRAQADKQKYMLYMKKVLENQSNLDLKQGMAEKILVKNNTVWGVETKIGEKIKGKMIVVSPGTFLRGLIHIGFNHFPGGRMGEAAAGGLTNSLKNMGFKIGRFKTGTCPRLDKRSINFSKLKIQYGDDPPFPFSFSTKRITQKQIPCYMTYTNPQVHQIIRNSLDRSPLYSGIIKATGVRYCPSIEDKIVKFYDKERHQIFLEPEGINTIEVYPNGLATSLPIDVQVEIVHAIEGLEKAKILRPGYGIEHDYVYPTQLKPSLETKGVENLFLAGQINGTTGYEEAAAQGLIAGINATRKIKGREPIIIDRSQGYIGVLIDDLVTKGTNEPYRMFTSRAEYRLVLREDNADLRLTEIGHKIGLVNGRKNKKILKKKEVINKELGRIRKTRVSPTEEINKKIKSWGSSIIERTVSVEELLKRPEVSYYKLMELTKYFDNKITSEVAFQVEIETKYQGYIKRQLKEIEKFRKIEEIKIPPNLEFSSVPGLSREVKEKLSAFNPVSLGQASRISGITPAAISILRVYLKSRKMKRKP
jgi:tRNA uridine 5-carboxymethylaminomethyl modification enzyme